jgi:hypothetical protein
MELKEILAISKLPGLYQIVASRDNGLIVTPLGEERRKFVASRQHMFTPLENITVYTNTDSIELSEIFKLMKAGKVVMPDPKLDDKSLRAYFSSLVPEHDQERVYISDIKKMMKWYVALDVAGIFEEKKEEKVKKESKETPKKAGSSEEKLVKKAGLSEEKPAKITESPEGKPAKKVTKDDKAAPKKAPSKATKKK